MAGTEMELQLLIMLASADLPLTLPPPAQRDGVWGLRGPCDTCGVPAQAWESSACAASSHPTSRIPASVLLRLFLLPFALSLQIHVLKKWRPSTASGRPEEGPQATCLELLPLAGRCSKCTWFNVIVLDGTAHPMSHLSADCHTLGCPLNCVA